MTDQEAKIAEAMALLRGTRGLMREANAEGAAKAVTKALKSADGARRYAQMKPYRDQRGAEGT